jgi:hypothetical protein
LFIPCLEGDYLSLADVLPRAVIAGHPSADEQYRRYEFMAISDRGQDSAEQAYWFGYDILEYGYQVVLDLASYTGLDRAIAIQVNIIKGMFHWANTHPDDRVPAHVFLDEAQRYLPQQLNDSVIVNSEVRTQLLKVYMDITAIGGKRGLSPVILSQRFAQVNNKIMAQSEVFFLMRQTNDNDLDRCMEYVNKQVCSKAQIAAFKLGQGVYIAADGTQQVVQFAPRESSGKRSRTPTAAAAARYASMPLYRPARHQEEEEQEREDAQEQARPSPSRESPLLERGVTAYRAGATTLVKLAAALDISEWKARSLMAQIQEELKKHE